MVGPLQVVDEQQERGVFADERDERLEHLDLGELRLRRIEHKLGKHGTQRREPLHVRLRVGEGVA